MPEKVKFKTVAMHQDTHKAWRKFRWDLGVQLARPMKDNDTAKWLLDVGRDFLDSARELG